MLVVGLTGGIGAGKDEVAGTFRKMGAPIIDADRTGHRLLKPGSPVYRKVVKKFSRQVLGKDGRIDREKLGADVFSSKDKLKTLNRLIHPEMEKAFLREIKKYKKLNKRVVVLNAAVLVEAGWDRLTDRVILVSSPRTLRMQRLKKTGLSKSRILSVMKLQLSDSMKKKKADYVIRNAGTLGALRSKAKEVWNSLKGLTR